MFWDGVLIMQPKMTHGKHTTVRYLIVEFVRLCAVWDVSNTCRFFCIMVCVQDIVKYLCFWDLNYWSYLPRSVLEEDEVFSVARLLGDLVAHASDTGHLELLAGLFLFFLFIYFFPISWHCKLFVLTPILSSQDCMLMVIL